MSNVIRILLILTLLACSRGRSVCFDGEGHAYLCAPELLAVEGGDCCPCPCDDDDCEEHELAFDTLLSESAQLPGQVCILLPSDHAIDIVLGYLCPNTWRPDYGFSADGPDPGFLTRGPLLASVVLRL